MKNTAKKTLTLIGGIIVSIIIMATSGCSRPRQEHVESYMGISFPKDSVDAYLKKKIDEYDIPGLAIAIVNQGEIVFHENYGYANVEKQIPITDQTIFEGASMSKSVFGHFVMTYVEDGKLDLDKPLYEYLPYPDLAHDDRYKKFTARMVLSHRTGLPNWRENEPEGKLKIKFEPGTRYEYSGEAYQYLALVLRSFEGGTWTSLENAFQRRIAKPLNLDHTVFLPNEYTRAHKAEPYDENGNWIDISKDEWHEEKIFGAAYSIHSEPVDFAKWMIGLMDKKILSTESYEELFKPHSKVPEQEVDIRYTLGFFKYPFPITHTYGHGGNNVGFTCYFTFDSEKDWGYVVFTNSEYGQLLGEELFFYLLAGPDLTIPYIILGTVALLILLAIVAMTRRIITKRRNS